MMRAVVCFLILIAAVSSTKLRPTTCTMSGPAYKPNSPHKFGIVCNPGDHKYRSVIKADGCTPGGACWSREFINVNVTDLRMILEGAIRNTDGQGLKGGILDVWQTDAVGRYGIMTPDKDEGYCRARLHAAENGTYRFHTDIPGAYGALLLNIAGILPRDWDTPPYLPRHLHVIAWAPGYEMVVTELHFDDDPSLSHDWRELLGHKQGTDPADGLTIKLEEGGSHSPLHGHFDFVLKASALAEYNGSYETALQYKLCTGHQGEFGAGAWFFCHPWSYQLFRPAILVVPLAGFLAVAYLVRRLCTRKKRRQTQQKFE